MRYEFDKAFDYENGFYLTTEPYRMGNILAHYELYKRILDIPGDVVECGVFKGSSLIQFATFREIMENENSRKIVGFDMFGEFPADKAVASDSKFIEKWNEQFAGDFLSKDDLHASLQHKGLGNVELVQGNIMETVDEYLECNPHMRIALLHVDTDVYGPSKKALEAFFERVSWGGIVVFDDYGTVEGESVAADEFLSQTGYVLHKFRFSHTKPSYFVKTHDI